MNKDRVSGCCQAYFSAVCKCGVLYLQFLLFSVDHIFSTQLSLQAMKSLYFTLEKSQILVVVIVNGSPIVLCLHQHIRWQQLFEGDLRFKGILYIFLILLELCSLASVKSRRLVAFLIDISSDVC